MKTAKEYTDEFYQMIWNNYDSSQDLTQMFIEYGKQCAEEALRGVTTNGRVFSRIHNEETDAQIRKEILSTEIKTP